jgi:hypothetical protein
MEFGVGHEFTRITRQVVVVVLSGHLDVTPQGQETYAVIGVASLESDQAAAEPNRKNLNPNSKKLGNRVVSELVNKDHHSQHEEKGCDAETDGSE